MSANDAIEIFNAGVEAVKPGMLLPQHLRAERDLLTAGGQQFLLSELDGVYLLSIGKAASAMAMETEKILGDRIINGLVVTKYHHSLPLQYCKTIEAGHPVPDDNSVAAAIAVTKFLQQLKPTDILLCCISGGASALLADVAPGVTLQDLQQLSGLLLQCGAGIHEMNTVRKHLSTLKGGRLVSLANGASITAFIISDVQGDDTSVIASGLTAGDASTFADAWHVLEKYGLTGKVPSSIATHITNGIKQTIPEGPKPVDAIFSHVQNLVTGTNAVALRAGMAEAEKLGFTAEIINGHLDGEAEMAAKQFVHTLLNYHQKIPACLLMGGETTVTVKGKGKGGRNQHFVLAAIAELWKLQVPVEKIPVILSGGTDGSDGPTDAAGAFVDKEIYKRIQHLDLNPFEYLADNNAYEFFRQVNGLLITGPTQTNVTDIVVGLKH